MENKLVINKLKELKLKSGLTSKDIASRSGVPYGTVIKIFSGTTKSVKAETYSKIEKALIGSYENLQNSAENYGFYGAVAVSPFNNLASPTSNANLVISEMEKASEKGASLLVLSELYLSGATLGDLYRQPTLLNACESALLKIVKASESESAITVVGLPICRMGVIYNVCAVVYGGNILGFTPCSVTSGALSGYNGEITSVNFLGKDYPFGKIVYNFGSNLSFGVAFQSEISLPENSVSSYAQAGANAVCVVGSLVETMLEPEVYKNVLIGESSRLSIGVISALSGSGESTTDGVCSGRCLIIENGEVLAENKPFSEKGIYAQIDYEYLESEKAKKYAYKPINGVITVNANYIQKRFKLERKHREYPFIPERDVLKSCLSAVNIQAQALSSRMKYIHADNLVLGISGGLDSTLAILVAVKAVELIGKERKNVIAITMPCFGTSSRTKNNAVTLCELLGVTLKEVNIKNAVLCHFNDIGHNPEVADIAYENSQARERTQVLMDYANKVNGIVVGTGDLSELALGWATYNGDHMSNYSVNASIPKTLVKEIVINYGNYLGGKIKEVLFDIADTPVSPELKPLTEKESSQKTEDIVGPYVLHDYFIYHSLVRLSSPKKIYEMAKVTFNGTFDSQTVLKWLKVYYQRFFRQQFKRSCVPDGVMVTSLSLSPRTSLKMPSDSSPEEWLKELENA
ncbi:MAG: NAD(+) synthase [Clostridia bacterium]|nr:NAD(+) synthase [Clostridia bacterium]